MNSGVMSGGIPRAHSGPSIMLSPPMGGTAGRGMPMMGAGMGGAAVAGGGGGMGRGGMGISMMGPTPGGPSPRGMPMARGAPSPANAQMNFDPFSGMGKK
jgi:hypothetical protein